MCRARERCAEARGPAPHSGAEGVSSRRHARLSERGVVFYGSSRVVAESGPGAPIICCVRHTSEAVCEPDGMSGPVRIQEQYLEHLEQTQHSPMEGKAAL